MRHTECRWVCIHSSSIYSNIFLYIQIDSSVWSVRIHRKGDDDDDAECIALECWLQRRHLLKYYLFVQFYFVFVFRFCSVVVANQKTVCFKYLLGILLRRVYFFMFFTAPYLYSTLCSCIHILWKALRLLQQSSISHTCPASGPHATRGWCEDTRVNLPIER